MRNCHIRNWCQCSQCGKWFRRNRGFHDTIHKLLVNVHFCSLWCSEAAMREVDWEVGWPYEPHYVQDEDILSGRQVDDA